MILSDILIELKSIYLGYWVLLGVIFILGFILGYGICSLRKIKPLKKELSKSRQTLRNIYDKYSDELNEIVNKIDNMLEILEDGK